MGNKGERQSSYPPEIKLQAIQLHLEEGIHPSLSMISRGL